MKGSFEKGLKPYLLVVFLNAFVDLGHKIIIQNTIFKIYDGQQQIILTAIVNALILLPFIFLFSPSGFLSDRYQKSLILRYGALLAVVATLIITASYYSGQFWLAFALTLVLAIQSAIYSPAKYGYIRELVGTEKIAKGNAFVQAVTIVAILGGTFFFSILFELLLKPFDDLNTHSIFQAIAPLGWVLVLLAVVEFVVSFMLPERSSPDESRIFSKEKYFRFQYLKENLTAISSKRVIWISILGLAMFWSVSQVVLAAFPAYAKEVLSENNTVMIQGLLACSGLGIMLGSLIAGKISRSHIELGLIPVGAIGLAISLFMIGQLESHISLALLFMYIGFSGGIFIIPLNALIQYHAGEKHLGTVLAGNNWLQNISMIFFLGLTVVFALSGFSSIGLFYFLCLIAIIGSIVAIRELPHSLARIVASVIIKRKYRVNVVGFENLPKEGAALLLGNHISWIDWLVVQIACPRAVHFVMLRSIYQKKFLKPLFDFFGVIPISRGSSKKSLEEINQRLREGKVVCLFPEGAISRNGHLGEFQRGFERVIEDVEGVIVPFYLRGLWGSWFSRSHSDKLRKNSARGIKRDIIVAFGEQLPLTTTADQLKQKVFELSISAWEKHTDSLQTLPGAWLKAAKANLSGTAIADSSGESLSNAKMIAAVGCFAKAIKVQSPEQNIGLLLPASSAGIIANMAVMLNGQTAVNLNYTSSAESVSGSIKNAEVKTVYTSAKFVDRLKSKNIDIDGMLQGCEVIYLEQFKNKINKAMLTLRFVLAYLLPAGILYRLYGTVRNLDEPAVILFSSGSEGTPKGIVLSHRNVIGNIKQISDVLNTQEDDVVMGSLPLFHSFGLTVTSFMPLVEGLPVVCHPDPTDVVNIAKAVARNRATILCATATFLNLFARNSRVKPLMLDSLRVVVAGAEKLTEDVRLNFQSKFNKEIFEGYGATETTPVASVNVPDKMDPDDWRVQVGQRLGTVGLPLPGSCFRIVDPETLETLPLGEDGLILISGTQVMLGYLNDPEKTEDVIAELDGKRWYKTGDKGHLDKDGFLTIVDRYSRFAKIGGEMVSLTSVEESIKQVLENNADKVELQAEQLDMLAVNIPDAKKGEAIVLLVTGLPDVESLRPLLLQSELNPMMLPTKVFYVEEIPKLGSGKKDFKAGKKKALELMQS